MTKNIFLFIAFISFSKNFAQDYQLRITPFIQSEIIYKDGTSEKGLLRFASSAFKPFIKKDESGKTRKIDYKLIQKIITNPETENERVFQYLNHNYNKFRIFVELIYSDILSIYIGSSNETELFYSDFDRQTIGEAMAHARFENDLNTQHLKISDTLRLPNGKALVLPVKYSYYKIIGYNFAEGETAQISYYLLKNEESKLYKVENTKRFLKKAKDIFNDCPNIANELEQNNISLDDLSTFIEYYKDICFDNNLEKD